MLYSVKTRHGCVRRIARYRLHECRKPLPILEKLFSATSSKPIRRQKSFCHPSSAVYPHLHVTEQSERLFDPVALKVRKSGKSKKCAALFQQVGFFYNKKKIRPALNLKLFKICFYSNVTLSCIRISLDTGWLDCAPYH